MSPRVQTGVPPPLGQEPVKLGVSPTGSAASVTTTEVAGPPSACSWMVQVSVLPCAMLSCAACTSTHSWDVLLLALALALAVAVGGVESDVDGDADGAGVGRASHCEVTTAVVVTPDAAGGGGQGPPGAGGAPGECHARGT